MTDFRKVVFIGGQAPVRNPPKVEDTKRASDGKATAAASSDNGQLPLTKRSKVPADAISKAMADLQARATKLLAPGQLDNRGATSKLLALRKRVDALGEELRVDESFDPKMGSELKDKLLELCAVALIATATKTRGAINTANALRKSIDALPVEASQEAENRAQVARFLALTRQASKSDRPDLLSALYSGAATFFAKGDYNRRATALCALSLAAEGTSQHLGLTMARLDSTTVGEPIGSTDPFEAEWPGIETSIELEDRAREAAKVGAPNAVDLHLEEILARGKSLVAPIKPILDAIETPELNVLAKKHDLARFERRLGQTDASNTAERERLTTRIESLKAIIDRQDETRLDPTYQAGLVAMQSLKKQMLDDRAQFRPMAEALVDSMWFRDIESENLDLVKKEILDFLILTSGYGASVLKTICGAADEAGSFLGWLEVGKARRPTDIGHELGHNFEYAYRRARLAAFAFLEQRAQGQIPIPLPELYPDEAFKPTAPKAFKGNFVERYVGACYPEVELSEVISIGMEYLRTPETMLALYRTDPEHFYLMLGLMEELHQ